MPEFSWSKAERLAIRKLELEIEDFKKALKLIKLQKVKIFERKNALASLIS